MATNVTLGKTLPLSISYLDQAGQPMLSPVTPDSAPVWTDSMPSIETLTVAPDGLTATAKSLATGADTISLSLVVGGQAFSASLGVDVVAAPQVLTSIAIVPGTPV